MNIKILDSWLREYVKTDATPQKLAEIMSLTSVSVERIEPFNNDFVYDIEVTTNRPDLMSVIGLAADASVVLPQHGIPATFIQPKVDKPKTVTESPLITIKNDPSLVRRICAVVMEVTIKESPQYIKDRLETSDIRSLNNIIDVTNYIMREVGHPTHVFDYDRLTTKQLVIREAKKGEKLVTLDDKEYTLPGGDVIADNGKGEIVDLLAVMGTKNSVVTNETKRILFFIDNVEPNHIRKTSMSLGIRTEAAVLNEKGIDPSLAIDALTQGITLFEKIANGKVVSEIIDIYPVESKGISIRLEKQKIDTVIGIPIPHETTKQILTNLGFTVKEEKEAFEVFVPSRRANDLQIQEDLIEEIARVYGYHRIPSALPPLSPTSIAHITNEFYWEKRIKEALKYWGFTEVYTYSMVGENLFEGELSEAVTIQNPLTEDLVYMRKTLIPSLLQVIHENKTRDKIKIFEVSNVYYKKAGNLPEETLHLAGIVKKPNVSFFEVKGLFEQIAKDIGIEELTFKPVDSGSSGAEMFIQTEKLGDIEILDHEVIDFEINYAMLVKYASAKKTYTPLPKHPPILEDMAFIISDTVTVGEIIQTIKHQSPVIKRVELLDKYKDTRTFRITYQDTEKNLTSEDVAPIREKIEKVLREKLSVQLK